MLKKISYERLMILFAALVQIIGFIISLTIEDFRNSIIPCAEKVIPIVNVSGALICVFLFFFNKYRLLQSVISFVQGIFMTLNGHLFLGTFLYSLGVALLFCNKSENKNCQKTYNRSVDMDFIYCKYNHEQYLSLSYGSGIFAFPWDNVCSYLSNCKKISSFTFSDFRKIDFFCRIAQNRN